METAGPFGPNVSSALVNKLSIVVSSSSRVSVFSQRANEFLSLESPVGEPTVSPCNYCTGIFVKRTDILTTCTRTGSMIDEVKHSVFVML